MQVIALITLFAKTFQPVLADEVVVVVVAMFVGTQVAQRAEALAIRLADWSSRIETEAVFAFEEIREGEIVGWRLRESVGVLVIEVHWCSSTMFECGGHVSIKSMQQSRWETLEF